MGMGISAAQAAAFYSEVAGSRTLWTLRDAAGFPAPKMSDGRRAQPFFSKPSRAARLVEIAAAYADFEVVELSWDDFVDRWAPGLTRDGILVGVNWSGPNATGYDVEPADVVRNVEALFER